MSVTNIEQLVQFPIHQDATSVTQNFNSIQLTVLIVGLIQFFLVQILLARKRIFIFLSTSKNPQIVKTNFQAPGTKILKKPTGDQQTLSETDMEMVLRSLGMVSGEGRLPSRLDSSDIFEMFVERNPDLDEVKEAFDVFDDDKDGFIDSNDLQKVMKRLGLKEGMELGNCMRMIGLFDENDDGRLDFQEFVKFMENSFN